MKSIKTTIIFTLACMFSIGIAAAANAPMDDLYKSAMQKAIDKTYVSRSANELMQLRGQFERISQKYPDKWQPVYYIAFCDLQMVYLELEAEKDNKENNKRLEDAETHIKKLEGFKDVDQSELQTLWGFYYTARIGTNKDNAILLFGDVLKAYEKALELNPSNPRAIILRVFFNNQLPATVKLKLYKEAEVSRATKFFEEEDKTIDHPYWGAYFIKVVGENKNYYGE